MLESTPFNFAKAIVIPMALHDDKFIELKPRYSVKLRPLRETLSGPLFHLEQHR